MKTSVRSRPPVAGGAELIQGASRPFGRLNISRQEREPPPPVPPLIVPRPAASVALESPGPLDLIEPQPTPIDSAKAFVGPNATFYDDRWRWMDWRGRQRSWNWAAAVTFGGWLAYRRMYMYAAIHAAWLLLLATLAAGGSPLELVVGAQLAVAVALGLYGNTLYLLHFRRTAREIFREQTEYAARVAALARAGGVDRRAVWVLAGATVLGVALIAAVLGLAGSGAAAA